MKITEVIHESVKKSVTEDATRHNDHARIKYGDLILDYKIDGANVDVRAIIDDKQVGYVIFLRDGKLLIPDDLAVDEEYRGRGIAKKMYDWVKSLPQGFRIIRSGIQTTMGKRFWDKNRGESGNVWEEGVTEYTVDEAKKRKRINKKNRTPRRITTGWWSGYYGDGSSGGEDGGGE